MSEGSDQDSVTRILEHVGKPHVEDDEDGVKTAHIDEEEWAFAINRAQQFVKQHDNVWRGGLLREAQEEAAKRLKSGKSRTAALQLDRQRREASPTPESASARATASNPQQTMQDFSAKTELSPTCIFEIPLLKLRNQIIDITSMGKATPGRFRLIDCSTFVNDNPIWTRKLTVHEFDDFPPHSALSYAALSYVWLGNPLPRDSKGSWGGFNVKGASEDSDPIGISIIFVLCQAVREMGYQYLWIDRLCIIQDDRHDKKLQIRNMHAVYKHCAICFVLPGGIQRIVGLNEETGWITRAWTLQEAIAPARTYVVYDRWDSRYRWSGETAQEVFPDGSFRYSMAPLADILASSIPVKGYSGYRPAIIRSTEGDLEASESARVQLAALWGAMTLKGAAKEQAIWRSALTRTSSRPVDMVYSIMGLFDVTLDTHAYGEDDRLLASRALAQATLQKGCAPNWLGTSFFLPPSRQLSTFPRVPETSVVNDLVQIGYTLPDGRWREVAAMMNNFGDARWWLAEMPSPTTIDDAGYLHFSSYAISAAFVCGGREFMPDFDNLHVADDGPSYVLATDGTIWAISDSPADLPDQRSTFMVFVGRQYPWDESAWAGDCTVRAVIVEEHSVGKCQILGWCWLGDVFMEWIKASWTVRSFRIGGPE